MKRSILILAGLTLLITACETKLEEPSAPPQGNTDTTQPQNPQNADVISFPDANFKAWLVARYDMNHDDEIDPQEALQVTAIDVSTEDITSLEGIGYLTNLETLVAKGRRDQDRKILGQLTALDLSGLPKLLSVDCRHNHIESLRLDGNASLSSLITYGNSLTSLDLGGAPNLTSVDAGDCDIQWVDASANTQLQTLYLHNNRIQVLDLRACTRLTALTADRNLLSELDLSACIGLTSLDCAPMDNDEGSNVLQSIKLSQGVTIQGVTVNRSSANIPDATSIIWVNAPQQSLTLGTGLRTLRITTPGGVGINSKDVWTENCSVTLLDDNGIIYYENTTVAVKGRGNSTWSYPKKPFTLKLPAKSDLIGTGEGKRWVLLANWMDRTLLRNDVAFELARRTSLDWTPSGEFVELYLNGQHQGNYWLGEQIKTGKSRVQADFIIEMDTYYDATWRFYSSYGKRVNQGATGMPIGVKEPDDDEMTDALFSDIKDLVAAVERSIYQGDVDYNTLLDATSFADWYLVHEITYNGEPNHPKSCYFHFRNGIMYAGPVWDFDWYTFQVNKSGLFIPQSIYFGKLLKDAAFVRLLKNRWEVLKPSFQSIDTYIDQKADLIRESESIDTGLWPNTSTVNEDYYLTFDAAVSRMKKSVTERIDAIDKALATL